MISLSDINLLFLILWKFMYKKIYTDTICPNVVRKCFPNEIRNFFPNEVQKLHQKWQS